MAEPPSFLLLAAASLTTLYDLTMPLGDRLLGAVATALVAAAAIGLSAAAAAAAESLGYGGEPGLINDWLERHRRRAVIAARLLQRLAFAAAVVFALMALFALAALRLGPIIWLWVALVVMVVVAANVAAVRLAAALGRQRPEQILRLSGPALRAWTVLCWPFATLLERLLPTATRAPLRPEQVRRRLHDLLADAPADDAQLQMVRNVLAFGDRTASDLMVPRPDVDWVATDESLEDALARIRSSGHSRLPLCRETPDQVIGYVHARDLALALSSRERQDLVSLARPVAFVPETARAPTLLKRFQEERAHLAIVVDEFGGMSGLITLEDVLEELVGEIHDEFDDDEVELQTLDNGELLVDGAVRLEVLAERTGIDFGDAEAETVGGLIFNLLAREVAVGDEVRLRDATLRVEGVEGLRVTRVRIVPAAVRAPVDVASGA